MLSNLMQKEVAMGLKTKQIALYGAALYGGIKLLCYINWAIKHHRLNKRS